MARDFVFMAKDFARSNRIKILFLHHLTQSKPSFLGAPYKYYGEVSALFSDCFKYYFKHFYLLLQGFFPLFSGKSAIVC